MTDLRHIFRPARRSTESLPYDRSQPVATTPAIRPHVIHGDLVITVPA